MIVLAALRANALRNPIQAFQNARKSGSSGKFKARLLRWGLEETPDPLELLSLSEAPKLIIATGCVYVHSNFLPFPFLSFLFLFPFLSFAFLPAENCLENRIASYGVILFFISFRYHLAHVRLSRSCNVIIFLRSGTGETSECGALWSILSLVSAIWGR